MGGNVTINGRRADKIDLTVIDRAQLYDDLCKLRNAFKEKFGCTPEPSGSTVHMFNIEYLKHKSTFGDIDFQVDKKINFDLRELEQSVPFKLIGTTKTTNTTVSLWEYDELNIQIDFEAVEFIGDFPSKWSRFAYSSHIDDISHGIKGVAHKYIFRALTAQWTDEYCVAMKTKNKMAVTSLYAFSNKGLRRKLAPTDDGRFIELTTAESTFYTDLESIFRYLISPSTEYTDEIDQAMWSFVGVVGLIKRFIHHDLWECIADGMAHLLFGKGAQRIYSDAFEDHDCKVRIMEYIAEELNMNMRRWDATIRNYYGSVQNN